MWKEHNARNEYRSQCQSEALKYEVRALYPAEEDFLVECGAANGRCRSQCNHCSHPGDTIYIIE